MSELNEMCTHNFSHNICYVHNAYAEYIKASKHNIEIANKVADKKETKTPEKTPVAAPQKSGGKPATHDELRALAGVIIEGLMEGGLTLPQSDKLVNRNWEVWANALGRVKGDFPTNDEIRTAAAGVAKDHQTNATPNRVANAINNARNPGHSLPKKDKPKAAEPGKSERTIKEIEELFKSACEDPEFLPRMKAKALRKWPDLDRMAKEQQRFLMLEQYDAELVEAGV
jgi:hypothetical protein